MYDVLQLAIVFDADYPVPLRRLEDRIQALAAKAVTAQDPAEFADVLRQLRVALHEHSTHLRKLAAEKAFLKITRPRTKRDPIAAMRNPVTDDMAAD